MTIYAADTSVSSETSRAEIERTIRRYGADRFAYGWDADRAMIGFQFDGRQIRFLLPMPDRQDKQFVRSPRQHRHRSAAQAYAAWEQACRQRWRALALVIKAKLEAVQTGITTFDEEFLAHIVVGDMTLGEQLIPQLKKAISENRLPRLSLPAPNRES